jgi:AcrR family transcriptional regulator
MPRITAPTLAEHRARQHAALLEAARELLVTQGPTAVTPAAVGARSGLARTSVYKYFASTADIIVQLVEDSLPRLAQQLREAVGAEATPQGKLEAYARTILDFAATGEHRVALVADQIDLPAEFLERLARRHDELPAPLIQALAQLGDPHPEITAMLIQGVLNSATHLLDLGRPATEVVPATLAFLRSAVTPQTS